MMTFALTLWLFHAPYAVYAQNGGNNAAPLRPVTNPAELAPIRGVQLPLAPPGGPQAVPPQQLPIDTPPAVDPNAHQDAEDSGTSHLEEALKAIGQMGGAGGGRGAPGPSSNTRLGDAGGSAGGSGSGGDRVVGGQVSPASSGAGIDNALQMGKTISQGGQEYTTIDGCSRAAGKFSVIYGHPPQSCSSKQDSNLKINQELADFMDKNLNLCAAKAVGSNSVSVGKIWHAGVMGDANHQKTGSLHNLGLAIDINAIQIGNETYKYTDAKSGKSAEFFRKFRQCWGEAAQTARGSCLKQRMKPPGTVGNEDSNHQNHLHLSLPYCPDKARQLGLYIALAPLFWLSQPTFAAEGPPPPTVRRTVIPISRGRANLIRTDQHGEPLDADQRFRVEVRCDADQATRTLGEDIGGCDLASFTYLPARDQLELRYRVSVMRDGVLFCGKIETKLFAVSCPAR